MAAEADPYACALRQVNELGFTLVDADRESGFLVAERQTTGALETPFGEVSRGGEDRCRRTAPPDRRHCGAVRPPVIFTP